MLVDSCESRLTVHLSCEHLRNMDYIGKSDPFAILYLDNTGATTRPPLPSQNMKQPPPTAAPTTTTSALVAQGISPEDDASKHLVARAVSLQAPNKYIGRDYRWQRIGQTETIRNSLNPVFVTSFEVPYFFERAQRLAVDVFDRDSFDARDDQLHLHDYLGSAEIAVPAVVRAKAQRLTVRLHLPSDPNIRCGSVTVAVEEVSEQKLRISYDVALRDLPRQRGPGPFLTIRRPSAAASKFKADSDLSSITPESNAPTQSTPSPSNSTTGSNQRRKGVTNEAPISKADGWITVYRSGAAKHDPRSSDRSNYIIPSFAHNYEKLCRCDENATLRFDISFEKFGSDKIVASALSSLGQAEKRHGEIILSPTSSSCFGSRKASTLHLTNRRMTEDTTFLDYVIGGCEISLVIAIDFTASNGDPSKIGTLHFCDSERPNEYELAIRSVGDILAAYDTDQLFPVFGFGAKLPPDYSTPSHLFSLTEDDIIPGAVESPNEFCGTIDGVLNAYRNALYNVRLSGPTVFAGIVDAAADHARRESRGNDQSYTILLIITDGVINDVDETLDALYRASSVPMSIVIIGVGDADFSDMNLLDGDDMGRERDIVQFVNFRQFEQAYEVLRSRVLEEIPTQFLEYMSKRNIRPLPVPED